MAGQVIREAFFSPGVSVMLQDNGVPIVRRPVVILNVLGLHLRPADQFVRLASQFAAEIRVHHDGQAANGKSILDLATLAAECGARLDLEARGPDAGRPSRRWPSSSRRVPRGGRARKKLVPSVRSLAAEKAIAGKMSRLEVSTGGRRRLSKARRTMQLRWSDGTESSPRWANAAAGSPARGTPQPGRTHQLRHDVHSVIRVVTNGARDLIGVRQAVTSVVIDPKHPRLIHVAAGTERYPHGWASSEADGSELSAAIVETNKPIRLTGAGLDADLEMADPGKAPWGAARPRAAGLPPRSSPETARTWGSSSSRTKTRASSRTTTRPSSSQLSRLAAIAIENAGSTRELTANDRAQGRVPGHARPRVEEPARGHRQRGQR